MGYRFESDPNKSLLRCVWEGTVTDDLLWENFLAAKKLVAAYSLRKAITDFSAVAIFDGSSEMVHKIAQASPAFGGKDSMLVVVAPSDYLYGMLRMFSMLGDSTRPNVHVVRTVGEAYALLGLSSPNFSPLNLP